MRPLLISAIVAASCHSGPSGPTVDDEPTPQPINVKSFRLGIPAYGGIDTGEGATLLTRYLGEKVGISVELVTAEPYTELPRLLAEGKVDVAELPPLPYVKLASQVQGLVPLAAPVISGTPTYLGHLYVREDSPYQTLAELRGARIGYVDKGSSSGYLFPRELLREHGLDPDNLFSSVRFFQSHNAVVQAVQNRDVDVGAAIDLTSGWSGLETRPAGLRVLGKTERIPHDCLVARPGFDPGAAIAVQEALLSLHVGDPAERKILQALHMNGWVKPDEARYDRIRAVLEREARSAH